MTDIIERLRREACAWDAGSGNVAAMLREAADEIEALRKDAARLPGSISVRWFHAHTGEGGGGGGGDSLNDSVGVSGGGGSAGFSVVAGGGGMGGLACHGAHEWRPIFGGPLGGGELCSRCGMAREIRQAPAG